MVMEPLLLIALAFTRLGSESDPSALVLEVRCLVDYSVNYT
jgi:hypothetical protein